MKVAQLVETKKDDHEHHAFMLGLLLKKMRDAGLESELNPAREGAGGSFAPFITTPWASFSVKTYFDDTDGPYQPFFNAWFHNGKRSAPISKPLDIKGVIHDIRGDTVKEEKSDAEGEEDQRDEQLMHRLMKKLLEREGYQLLPFDDESVDLELHVFKIVVMYFAGREKPWVVSWFNKDTNRLVERNRVKTPQHVLRLFAQYRGQP